jgi:diguanylate cyclase (GGDEF)-like protein
MKQIGAGISALVEPVLINSPLFASLSTEEFEAVAALLEHRHIARGQKVFSEGDSGKELFIFLSGELSASETQTGEIQRWMVNIKAGDFFGEMSIIANEAHPVTVIARADSELMVFRDTDFFHFVFHQPHIGVKLLKAIGDVQNIWLEQISRYLNDLVRWGETARRRAVTDDLTGLYNRRFFEDAIKNRFEQGVVQARNIALLIMDLDKVHEINEIYGSPAGDQVIFTVAEILLGHLRNGDVAARFSGDEFAVLLRDADEQAAWVVAERIREAVFSREISLPPGANGDGAVTSVQISIGVAAAPAHAGDADSLILKADDALLKAKKLGRNRVEIAD